MSAILKEDPPDLPETVPGALRNIVTHCLEKEPGNRFQSARDLGFALSSLAHASRPSVVVAAPPRRRTLRIPAMIAAAVALVAIGALTDYLLRPAPQPVSWSGAILGGPAFALDARVSPDGQMLAFQTLVGEMTQVAVMKPESGNWAVLTHAQDKGLLVDLSWSWDGTRIYYDRATDTPQGVFSVPLLGGEERLVLEDAMFPQALPDGSLLVTRMSAERRSQIFHFWPETGKLQALPVYIPPEVLTFFRVAPDGKEAIIFGVVESVDSVPRLYAFDVNTGAARRIAKDTPLETQVQACGVTRDGKSWLAIGRIGNLCRLVALDRAGRSAPRTLLTLTIRPWSVEGGPDGSIYMEQMERPGELLDFPLAGGRPQTIASFPPVAPSTQEEMFALLPDGRAVLGSTLGGRSRLVVVARGLAVRSRRRW